MESNKTFEHGSSVLRLTKSCDEVAWTTGRRQKMPMELDEDLDGKFLTIDESNLVTYSDLCQSLPQDEPRCCYEQRMGRERQSWNSPSLSIQKLPIGPQLDKKAISMEEVCEVRQLLDIFHGLDVLEVDEQVDAIKHLTEECNKPSRWALCYGMTPETRVVWLDKFFKGKISERLKSRGEVNECCALEDAVKSTRNLTQQDPSLTTKQLATPMKKRKRHASPTSSANSDDDDVQAVCLISGEASDNVEECVAALDQIAHHVDENQYYRAFNILTFGPSTGRRGFLALKKEARVGWVERLRPNANLGNGC